MARAIFLALGLGLLAGCTDHASMRADRASAQEWPTTCDEAVEKLAADLPAPDKAKLAAMRKDDLILLHHGFGTGIRNEFGLWGGNIALIKSCSGSRRAHPDDVSMILIERLWASLQ